MHMSKMGQHARRNGQHYIVITSEFGTTWSRWDTMKVIGYVYIANKISMNLLRMFSRNIHEMINAFMKTRPIFQPPHSRDFMDLQMMLCTTPFFKKHNL